MTQAALQAARRLRQQRRMRRCAAAADGAAAPMEQRQRHAGFFTGFDQGVLRTVLRPEAAITPASFAESE